jgi:RNA recognition motif-containing protein
VYAFYVNRFVTVDCGRAAQQAIESLDGFQVRDKSLRVSVKLPKEAVKRQKEKKEVSRGFG